MGEVGSLHHESVKCPADHEATRAGSSGVHGIWSSERILSWREIFGSGREQMEEFMVGVAPAGRLGSLCCWLC